MIDTESIHCTGCSACMNICPEQAITMIPDREGFATPYINHNQCTQCGECDSCCPIKGTVFHAAPLYCFAGWAKDPAQVKKSSSGGIFPILAEHIFVRNGYVAGAAIDESFSVRHELAKNQKQLSALRFSKYVQSDTGNIFSKIKDLLQSGKKILFSGTPCQVAGLNNFLNTDDPNFLTVEILCKGVASPGFFKRYIKDLENENIAKVSFRDKKFPWKDSYYNFSLQDKQGKPLSEQNAWDNPFYRAYLKDGLSRKSCSQCKFTDIRRCADITLGDFDHHNKEVRNDCGTSLILLNSPKGSDLLPFMEKMATLHRYSIEEARAYNRPLSSPAAASAERPALFQAYRNKNNLNNWLEKHMFHVGIFGLTRGDNVGTLLHTYALFKAVNDLGYQAEVINFFNVKPPKDPVLAAFRHNWLNLTPYCPTRRDLQQINYRMKRILVGSDVLWWKMRMDDVSANMLDWAWGDEKSLACYASSFGAETYEGSLDKDAAQKLLHRFDAISVREDSGLNICRDFGVEATHVLDPTLLHEADTYEAIINQDCRIKLPPDKYILVVNYHRNNSAAVDNGILDHLFDSKYEIVNGITDEFGQTRSVGTLLNLVKNAAYVITDSYHFTIFSLIFHKPFLSLMPPDYMDAPARIPSLLKQLGVKNRICGLLEDINEEWLDMPIDYETCDSRLKVEREKSMGFLKKALKMPLVKKEKITDPQLLKNMSPKLEYLVEEACDAADNAALDALDHGIRQNDMQEILKLTKKIRNVISS
ncbi:polysaccharide pyruvyl transferase family protein [Desulfovibrio sp. JC022]|uniref:polysaccharide pyruvyl transferase family protein n=1 Tax=Desulfovibrio sp. JC022 TaxID=2593642 RepID=UPI0013D4DD43|nr:polysaccharide pyruvyl transferase family protein [Desulfovibrio sp. JC022]NDV22225.1 4Fe-4S dicluster domain-containing protein [Desulfovibrio sp. JC022]